MPDSSAFWSTSFPVWRFAARGAIVYVVVLLLLRIAGKRQVAQMSASDFVVLLLISNAVQNSMNGGDNSITGGIVLAATLIALGSLFSYLTYRSKRLENLIEGTPRILVHHGKIIDENLHRERLSTRELRTMLRHQGVYALDDLQEAVLESDGSLSVIRKSDSPGRPQGAAS